MAESGSSPRQGVKPVSRGARVAAFAILILVLIMGAAAVVSSYLESRHYQETQQAQGALVELRLCTTLDKLAALKPPAGSPAGNPSRLYEQNLSKVLAQLKPDLGCKT